jgi:hypothetical protein
MSVDQQEAHIEQEKAAISTRIFDLLRGKISPTINTEYTHGDVRLRSVNVQAGTAVWWMEENGEITRGREIELPLDHTKWSVDTTKYARTPMIDMSLKGLGEFEDFVATTIVAMRESGNLPSTHSTRRDSSLALHIRQRALPAESPLRLAIS